MPRTRHSFRRPDYMIDSLSPHFATKWADVTPNLINVQKFGATGDGTTDDTTAIQAAFDVSKGDTYNYNTHVYFPNGTYRVTASLDLTNRRGMIIEGESREGVIIDSEISDKISIDICGSSYLEFRNLTINGDQTNDPKVAFFHARTTAANGEVAAYVTYKNITITGYFTHGAWLGFSNEINKWENCVINMTGQASNEFGWYSSAYNDYSMTSDYATLSSTASNAVNWLENCSTVLFGSAATSFVPVKLGREAHHFSIKSCYFHSTGNYHIETTGNQTNLNIHDVSCEGAVTDTIRLKPYSGSASLQNLRINGVSCSSYTSDIIHAESGVTINECSFDNLFGGNGTSGITLDDVNRSFIRWFATNNSVGGIVINGDIYHSEVWIPPSGITFNGNELYNLFHHWGGSGSTGNVTSIAGGAFAIGTEGLTARAEIDRIITATSTWNPGTVASGAGASTTVTLTGALASDVASGTINAQASGLLVTYEAYGGGVRINVMNHTGAGWTPGTLNVRVVATRYN